MLEVTVNTLRPGSWCVGLRLVACKGLMKSVVMRLSVRDVCHGWLA